MGPNNEDSVSYDIDLDKSVPELVTEYELLSQGSVTRKSEMKSESTSFSSSASSTTFSKSSRIPVAVDNKKPSIITRQNTYTIENSKDEDSSCEQITDVAITEVDSTEDDVDASTSSTLQRQNTYTVKTSTVQKSQKISQSINSFSLEESSSNGIIQLGLQQENELNIQNNEEIREDVTENNVGFPISEEILENNVDTQDLIPETSSDKE